MKGIKNNMDIKKYREEIDQIDKDIANLFSKRMEVVKQIAIFKNENNLPIFDENREQEIINKNLDLVDEDLKENYKKFLINLMDESKKYQAEVIKNLKNNK